MSDAQINPAVSLGDAGELCALLEEAGFSDVTVTARSYTVQQPRNSQLISQIFASCASFLPRIAAMDEEQRAELAKSVEAEMGFA